MNQPIRPPSPDEETIQPQAQLTNMRLALMTLKQCMAVPESMPRFGLLYGFSGYGKTVAAAFAAARTNAAYVEARSIWTQRSLLSALAASLGISHIEKTGPLILDQIISLLCQYPRPLIIDEMDYLVKKQSVDILRDIHDNTGIAIMMIGEEALPAKLMEWERFHNRILIATAAQPASQQDVLALREHYCHSVALSDDLVMHIAKSCRGVIRRIVTNLERAQQMGLDDGRTSIDLEYWGNRRVDNGELTPRGRAA